MGRDGKAQVKQYQDKYKIYTYCKNCTPEKPSKTHRSCQSIYCICIHHPGGAYFATEEYRKKLLRTTPKPGDPDFKAKDDKPFCDDQPVEQNDKRDPA
jgi:hypothetical protein